MMGFSGSFGPGNPGQLTVSGAAAAWGQRSRPNSSAHALYTGVPVNQAIESSGDQAAGSPSSRSNDLLQVAQMALKDAGLASGGGEISLIVCGLEQVNGLAQSWAPFGQVYILSQSAHPLVEGLEQAAALLESGAVRAVVLAEAAGAATSAVVLSDEPGQGYAQLAGYAASAGDDAATVAQCAAQALQGAGLASEQVGLALFSENLRTAAVEAAGLAQVYRSDDCLTAAANPPAVGNLAGLAAAALALRDRFLPAYPGWEGPEQPEPWAGSAFYIPPDGRPWFTRPQASTRAAAVSSLAHGRCVQLVLVEQPHVSAVTVSNLDRQPFYLFPLVSDSHSLLLEAVERLAVEAAQGDLPALARQHQQRFEQNSKAVYCAAIAGHDPAEIQREAALALKALPGSFENGKDWQTPLGSCFTPKPVGSGSGGVAFVYPGAFNSYPGVSKDLFYLYPWLHAALKDLSSDIGRVLCERQLYPRSLQALDKDALALAEKTLNEDPIAMLSSGTTLAVVYTLVLRQALGIHPLAAFGYSLGENSMMFATGVWKRGDEPHARLASSQAFHTRLAGPLNAVRESWGLPTVRPGQEPEDGPLWGSYLIMAEPGEVRRAMAAEQRVYLTHINTPRQVVIAGDPAACERVVAAVKATSLKAPFEYALHCEAIRSEWAELMRLHAWPVETIPDVRLYTAAQYGPVRFDDGAAPAQLSTRIAQNIATALCSPLDFPRLIDQVYAGGARVFIELGAGSNCARWVDESLKDRPHAALAINRKGTDDHTAIVRLLARLCTQRVPVSLSVTQSMELMR